MASGAGRGGNGGGSRWLRRLVLSALVIGTMMAVRQWALSRADQEFEQRLLEADRKRN